MNFKKNRLLKVIPKYVVKNILHLKWYVMHHIVYLDSNAKDLDHLLTGQKTLIVRGAMSPKIPFGRVAAKDVLYFLLRKGDGSIKAKASVVSASIYKNLSEEDSHSLIEEYQDRLLLSTAQLKRTSGKKYITLMELSQVDQVTNLKLDVSLINESDNWLILDDIRNVLEAVTEVG